MYLLKKRTTGQKTGFWDQGHENRQKSCQNDTKKYCEGITMINWIKTQTVEIHSTQQKFRELHIIKIWSSIKQPLLLVKFACSKIISDNRG